MVGLMSLIRSSARCLQVRRIALFMASPTRRLSSTLSPRWIEKTSSPSWIERFWSLEKDTDITDMGTGAKRMLLLSWTSSAS
jgi:hypothetical protein